VQREKLGIKTIGSIDVKKRARKVLRQRKDPMYRERKRRAGGVLARAEYLARSLPPLQQIGAKIDSATPNSYPEAAN